jgi:hypothetical protein
LLLLALLLLVQMELHLQALQLCLQRLHCRICWSHSSTRSTTT